MNESNRLLREYAEQHSEPAFRELVERYIDLVYSVAVRRTGGDAHRAEDIVQTVFTDLARKAPDLSPNVQLGGWLHKHCCFVASTVHRSESRRLARERQAMDLLNSEGSGESSWEELAPVLDEAIQELQEPDREALVMRYFEKRDLRSVGAALGTTEDAAQKRVSRALDKLRGLLAARGVALSITALTAHLASSSILAAPAGWAAKIGSQALEQTALTAAKVTAASGILATFLGSSALKIGGLAAAVAFFIGALVWKGNHPRQVAADANNATTAPPSASTPALAAASAPAAAPELAALSATETDDTNALRIVLISKDTGQPVANGRIDYRAWEGDKFSSRKLSTDDSGVCTTIISRETLTDLELTTRIDGFADTRLKWWPKRGDKIPQSYTVKLERGVSVGGRVVDASGQPVQGAKVGFNHDENPIEAMRTESHLFSWIEVETDSDGRWKIDRIADHMIRQLRGGANHSDYVGSAYLQVADKPGVEKELRDSTHLFTLGAAATVRGVVLDESGLAIPIAKILVGQLGWAGSRKATTDLDGTFEVKGCTPGKSMITAEAPQYSAATIPVEISLTASDPHKIVLKAGKILRMRVVNRAGQPVPRAYVWLNTMDPLARREQETVLVQTEFAPRTDEDGRVFWDQAPDRDLTFDIQGKGYMRASGVKVPADGQEHLVTLQPALKITGTVIDAKTGEPIPKFKVIAGWPNRSGPNDPDPKPHWSTLDRYWLSFADGKFEYSWEEPVLHGTPEIEYIFKIEAEGYTPHVTRVINAKEESAHFDVRLEPAKATLVTVLRPGGTPAANTDVVLAAPGQHIEISTSGFPRRDGIVLTTDAKGQFSFSPDESVAKVFAANREGFAEMSPAGLLQSGTLQMQSWGRLEGTFTRRGKRVSGKQIVIDRPTFEPDQPRIRVGGPVSTDAEGQFTMPAVPHGQFKLSSLVPVEEHGGGSMHVPFQTVEIRSGETTVVNYDENGAEVRVRLEWPADFKRDPKHQVMAMMATAFPQPPAEALNNREALMAWQMSPEIQALVAKAQHIGLRQGPDGLWTGEDARPGNYTLTFAVLQPTETPGPMQPLLQATKQITIPESPEEKIDLGTLTLTPPTAAAN